MNLKYRIMQNPKTTLSGIFAFLMGVGGIIAQVYYPGTPGPKWLVAASAIIGLLAGCLGIDASAVDLKASWDGGKRSALSVLLAFLCLSLVLTPVMGCRGGATSVSVAQKIVDYVPALDSAANTVSATIEALVPADAIVVGVADAAFVQLSQAASAAAKAYAANPSPSELTNLQNTIVALQQSVSTALLNSIGLKDPHTLKLVQAALNGIATILLTVLGLVQSVSTKAQLERMSNGSPIKLARVLPLLDGAKLQQQAEANGVSVSDYFGWEAQHGF
jgi:hypothetical protein